jgi:putative SOS response-associated peptidase YedK
MCNHFQNIPGAAKLVATWREYISWSLKPDATGDEVAADLWPKRKAAIVRQADEGAIVELVRWGVPLTMAGKRPGTTVTKHVTNVRNLSSPFWRSMLQAPAQRCLVPFTRFAEPKPNAGREEVWFAVPGAEISAFAGIWRESEEGAVFAFLTCQPNPLVAPIHPKAMPVILHPEDYARWLEGAPAEELAVPFPSQLMAIS